MTESYRDRSTGLMLFGLAEIGIALLGLGLTALMSLLMISPALRVAQQQAGSTRSMLAGFLVYPLAAAFFATMGVGTLLGRRWARAIMLVVSWIWLAFGILASVAMVFLLPKIMKAAYAAGTAGQAEGARAVKGCVTVVAGVGVLLVYIVLPLVFWLFYRSPHVKATCEIKDPRQRWTDRCPQPVLAGVFFIGYCSVGGLFGLAYGVFPLGAYLLTGAAALVAFLGLGVANAVLCVGFYRLRPAAWWGVLTLWGAFGVSSFVALIRGVPWREMYRVMGTPEAQLEVMEKSGILAALQGPGLAVPVVLGFAAAFAYLFWVRKYFYGYRDPRTSEADAFS